MQIRIIRRPASRLRPPLPNEGMPIPLSMLIVAAFGAGARIVHKSPTYAEVVNHSGERVLFALGENKLVMIRDYCVNVVLERLGVQ